MNHFVGIRQQRLSRRSIIPVLVVPYRGADGVWVKFPRLRQGPFGSTQAKRQEQRAKEQTYFQNSPPNETGNSAFNPYSAKQARDASCFFFVPSSAEPSYNTCEYASPLISRLSTSVAAFAQPKFMIQDLGTLPNMPSCTGTAISQSGMVTGYCNLAGGSVFNDSPTHPFLYSSGVMKDLGTTSKSAVPTGVNDSGVVVGTYFNISLITGLAVAPFIYQNGAIQKFNGVPPGMRSVRPQQCRTLRGCGYPGRGHEPLSLEPCSGTLDSGHVLSARAEYRCKRRCVRHQRH